MIKGYQKFSSTPKVRGIGTRSATTHSDLIAPCWDRAVHGVQLISGPTGVLSPLPPQNGAIEAAASLNDPGTLADPALFSTAREIRPSAGSDWWAFFTNSSRLMITGESPAHRFGRRPPRARIEARPRMGPVRAPRDRRLDKSASRSRVAARSCSSTPTATWRVS